MYPGNTDQYPFKGRKQGKDSNVIPRIALLSWAKGLILLLAVLASGGLRSPEHTPAGLPKLCNVLKM